MAERKAKPAQPESRCIVSEIVRGIGRGIAAIGGLVKALGDSLAGDECTPTRQEAHPCRAEAAAEEKPALSGRLSYTDALSLEATVRAWKLSVEELRTIKTLKVRKIDKCTLEADVPLSERASTSLRLRHLGPGPSWISRDRHRWIAAVYVGAKDRGWSGRLTLPRALRWLADRLVDANPAGIKSVETSAGVLRQLPAVIGKEKHRMQEKAGSKSGK